MLNGPLTEWLGGTLQKFLSGFDSHRGLMENNEEGLYVLESEDEWAWWHIHQTGGGVLTYSLDKATRFSDDERREIMNYPIYGWNFKTVKEATEDFKANN